MEAIDDILHDSQMTAEEQVADVNEFCWAIIHAIFYLQKAVKAELSGLDDATE
jgi:hypothetical protein